MSERKLDLLSYVTSKRGQTFMPTDVWEEFYEKLDSLKTETQSLRAALESARAEIDAANRALNGNRPTYVGTLAERITALIDSIP